MSKAEERALEYCCIKCYNRTNCGLRLINGRNCITCSNYIQGYHQAEKDLELSWEDIEAIDQIFTDVFKDGFDVITNSYYQEVLKRFKEMKG